jgi:hypothetical protein
VSGVGACVCLCVWGFGGGKLCFFRRGALGFLVCGIVIL